MDYREVTKRSLALLLFVFLFLPTDKAKAQVTVTGTTTVSITAVVIDPNAPPPSNSGAGNGGGGGGSGPVIGSGQVRFSGRAYPGSLVTLLQDARVMGTVRSSSDANFSLTTEGVNGGTFIFSLFSEDYKGNRSSLVTFPVAVSGAGTTYISNIFIAPTIATDKTQVKQGDFLSVFGQSTPGADIQINVHSANELSYTTRSDAGGVYLFNVDSSKLEFGEHTTQARAMMLKDESFLSKSVSFSVGLKNILAVALQCSRGDLSNDCKVNLIDFSILSYWYQRPNPPAKIDLNGDGKITITDFSIMIFNWTG